MNRLAGRAFYQCLDVKETIDCHRYGFSRIGIKNSLGDGGAGFSYRFKSVFLFKSVFIRGS